MPSTTPNQQMNSSTSTNPTTRPIEKPSGVTKPLATPPSSKQNNDNSNLKVDINIYVTVDTDDKQTPQKSETSPEMDDSEMSANSKTLNSVNSNKKLENIANAHEENLDKNSGTITSNGKHDALSPNNAIIDGTLIDSNDSLLWNGSNVLRKNVSTEQDDLLQNNVDAHLEDDSMATEPGEVIDGRAKRTEGNGNIDGKVSIPDDDDRVDDNSNENSGIYNNTNNNDNVIDTSDSDNNIDTNNNRLTTYSTKKPFKLVDNTTTTTTTTQSQNISTIPTTNTTVPATTSTTTSKTTTKTTTTTTTKPPPPTTTTKPPPPTTTPPAPITTHHQETTKTNSGSKSTPASNPNLLRTPETLPILDAVSYFGIREFLDDEIENKHQDVYLIPLRITRPKTSQDRASWTHYGEVDPTVTASSVHALLISTVSGLVDMDEDKELQLIFGSSLRLLTWLMSHQDQLTKVTHTSYFPSRFQLYWMTSRIAFHLNMEPVKNRHLFDFASEDISQFLASLRKGMTMAILSSIRDDGLGPNGQTRVYVDDFIGTGDLTDKGDNKVSGDDRLFTSAMAANALISTWSSPTFKPDGLLQFHEGTPDAVRIAVNSLVNFISKAVLDPKVTLTNAYVSEKVKGCKTLPAWYPFNKVTSSVNGEDVKPAKASESLRFGVEGYIPSNEYQQEMKKTRFGLKLPTMQEMTNLNHPTSAFRFWSSDDLTRAASILAIAQAADLKVDDGIGA